MATIFAFEDSIFIATSCKMTQRTESSEQCMHWSYNRRGWLITMAAWGRDGWCYVQPRKWQKEDPEAAQETGQGDGQGR